MIFQDYQKGLMKIEEEKKQKEKDKIKKDKEKDDNEENEDEENDDDKDDCDDDENNVQTEEDDNYYKPNFDYFQKIPGIFYEKNKICKIDGYGYLVDFVLFTSQENGNGYIVTRNKETFEL